LILAIICLFGLAVRTSYELLKKAGKVNTDNKAIFAIVFAGMGMLLMSWPFLSLFDPAALAIPGAVRWLGYVISAAGVGLAIGGVIQLKGLENIDHLVIRGLYTRNRHPMYTGFIFWIVGWIVSNGAIVSCFLGFICILVILFWRRLEEQNLVRQFGEEYVQYRKSTWF
jgi:protein-S-isoprenylcysteine O-methyltransferase Ste14